MILQPQTRDELCRQLAQAFAAGKKVSRVNLSVIAALVEHLPEDMTATVEGGMMLAAFQAALRQKGQWLPIDPPSPHALTIADLLAFDRSGPRRLGYGTIRDYLIGVKVVLADGQVIKAGGKVVKNVAGYDLCKLFIGARHSLGIIVEATFKLRPLPESDRCVHAKAGSFAELEQLSRALLSSPATPILLDAHNLDGPLALAAAFDGMREDVEFQMGMARSLGFAPADSPDYHDAFWHDTAAEKISVLPSKCISTLAELKADQFLAHVGNGVILYRGGGPAPRPALPGVLMQRVKYAYDSKQILPNYES